jgi:hypothetical protein
MKKLFQKSKLKNLYFGGFLFIIAAAFVVSCAKNDDDTAVDTTQTQALATAQQDCSQVLVNNTVTQLLEANSENAEDMKQNMIIFHYANAFRAITENSTYKQNIAEAFIQNSLHQVTVPDLISVYPAMASLLNEKLIESIDKNRNVFPYNSDPDVANFAQDPNWDANAYLIANDNYHGEAYAPTIYSASEDFSQISTTQIPTIAISQDVNDCDEIIGWKGSDVKLLDQSAVENGSDFVILVDNGDVETTSSSKVQILKSSKTNAVTATERMAGLTVVLDALKIKGGFRFGSFKRSAKVMGGILVFKNNSFDSGFRADMAWNPIKVTVDDVNNSRNFTYSPGKPSFTIPMNRVEDRLHMAIWESDWNRSLKIIPQPSGCVSVPPNADQLVIVSRRAHKDDIYLNVCGPSINSVLTNPTTTLDNTTSTFVFTRF